MKNLAFLLLILFVSSCTIEDNTPSKDLPPYHNLTHQELVKPLDFIAKSVALSLSNDALSRTKIIEKAESKFDGDANVLFTDLERTISFAGLLDDYKEYFTDLQQFCFK